MRLYWDCDSSIKMPWINPMYLPTQLEAEQWQMQDEGTSVSLSTSQAASSPTLPTESNEGLPKLESC